MSKRPYETKKESIFYNNKYGTINSQDGGLLEENSPFTFKGNKKKDIIPKDNNDNFFSSKDSSDSDEFCYNNADSLNSDKFSITSTLNEHTLKNGPKETASASSMLIGDVLNYKRRTLLNKFLWGGAFGALLTGLVILLYDTSASISPSIYGQPLNQTNTNFTNHTKSVSEQLDQLNFIFKTSMGLVGNTILNYLTFLLIGFVSSGTINVLWKAWQEKQPPYKTYGSSEYSAIESENENKIKELYKLIVEDNTSTKLSTKQNLLNYSLLTIYLAFNVFSVLNYFAGSSKAEEKGLLPSYDSVVFKTFNKLSGPLSFAFNLLINQWFAASELKSNSKKYNLNQLKKRLGLKNTGISIKNILTKFLLSSIFALPFLCIAFSEKNDVAKDFNELIAILAICTTPIVYGILNLSGAIEILNDFGRLWQWLTVFPQPLKDAWNELCKKKYYSLNIFGYFIYNLTEFSKELAYYCHCYDRYTDKKNNDLSNNRSEISIDQVHNKVKEELKSLNSDSLTGMIIEAINEVKNKMIANKNQPISREDIWKNGRVKNIFIKLPALIGASPLLIILFAYLLAVNEHLTKHIYQPMMNLEKTDPVSISLSLCIFSGFAYLVLKSGYKQLTKIFNTIAEFKLKQLKPKSIAALGILLYSAFFFFIKIGIFLAAPTTSGTAIDLLDTNGYYNSFTGQIAFWYTGLFNSLGALGFVDWIKTDGIPYLGSLLLSCCSKNNTYPTKSKPSLIQQCNTFFTSLKELKNDNYNYDLNEMLQIA